MKTFSSELIFGLSVAELAVGALKAEVALMFASTYGGATWIILFSVLLEAALCLSVNTFSILNARATPGANLEWKLLAVAAAFDAFLLFFEFLSALAFASTVKDDRVEQTRTSCLYSVVTFAGMATLVAPLAAHFLRTTDRAALLFSSVGEKIASITAVSISTIPVLAFAWALYITAEKDQAPSEFAFVLSSMAPLLTSTGLSVYGAITRDKAALLSILLVTVPPSFSLSFVFFKYRFLDEYGKKRESNDAAQRQTPTEDPLGP